MSKNIFYFNHINKIGGTENFLWEIVKKYHDLDIAIYYDTADSDQIKRLSEYVKCEKRVPGQKVECEKAFYNFNIDMINDVEAKEHIFICHAIYQVIKETPPIRHHKITKYIGVSNYSSNMLKILAKEMGLDIEVETYINPLTLEAVKKPKVIMAACRLDDEVKGGKRTLQLINELDRYCKDNPEEHYLFYIFSNPISFKIESPNVVIMKPRTDIRPFYMLADYVAQLSDDMETYCYTINEALGYGIPIITTPLSITKELDITKDMQIILNWDCSNIKEVVKKIFKRNKPNFKYKVPVDNWRKILVKGKNQYNPDELIDVECIESYTDLERNEIIPIGKTYKVKRKRVSFLKTLGENGLVKEIN